LLVIPSGRTAKGLRPHGSTKVGSNAPLSSICAARCQGEFWSLGEDVSLGERLLRTSTQRNASTASVGVVCKTGVVL
jgi:hypothetical protein